MSNIVANDAHWSPLAMPQKIQPWLKETGLELWFRARRIELPVSGRHPLPRQRPRLLGV